ncbi:AUGMIN subunit 8 [Zea mays]|uniref:AUGMIN subunit 8 n=1 Tax=Zea mays TaxID=4577 RepID=B4FHM7_MAIZE|nr:unknown [Zea mays]ACL53938.1 unknown [Zea mays]ACN34978.1 unknown [Zea mays]ACR34215.1 unknown [Zea mays]AQK75730.1 AUGMIN subunit 8 [Zea mays]
MRLLAGVLIQSVKALNSQSRWNLRARSCTSCWMKLIQPALQLPHSRDRVEDVGAVEGQNLLVACLAETALDRRQATTSRTRCENHLLPLQYSGRNLRPSTGHLQLLPSSLGWHFVAIGASQTVAN